MKRAIFVSAAVCLTAALIIVFFRTEKNHPSLFIWDEHGASYDIKVKTWTSGASERNTNCIMNVTGVLNVRAFKYLKGYRVAMQVSADVLLNGKHNESYEKSLGNIFYVYMAKDGRMINFIFPERTAWETSEFVKGVILPFEMVLRSGRKNYVVKQSDNSGDYVASYSAKSGIYHRKKMNYLKEKVADKNLPLVSVISSEAEAVPDYTGCWLRKMKSSEKLSVNLMNAYRSDIEINATLEKKDSTSDSEIWSLGENDAEKVRETYEKRTEDKKEIVKVDLTAIDRCISMQDKAPSRSLTVELRKMLLDNPELIKELPGRLLKGNLNDRTISGIINSLGIISIPEAQEALVKIASGNAFNSRNRFMAVMAFFDIKKPLSSRTYDYIFGQFDNLDTKGSLDISASSAMLAAGAIANNLSVDYPEESGMLNSKLNYLLNSADNAEQKRVALLALGNTKNEENIGVLDSYTNDSDKSIRIAAIGALGKYESRKVADILVKNLEAGDNEITSAVLGSLKGKELDSGGIEKVGDVLLSSDDPFIKRSSISILAENKQNDREGVKKILKEAMGMEASRRNLESLIKAYSSR